MKLLLIYLIAINTFAVAITVYDKLRAIAGRWRVSELTLLLVSAAGGSAAMLLTMLIIRHKTRHIKFMLGIPIIILIQLASAIFIWRFIYA